MIDILDITLPAPPFLLLGDRAGGVCGDFHLLNAAEYRIYRSNSGVPDPETDSPAATVSSLPSATGLAWADGDWWIIVTEFNGVVESKPLPVGDNGEPFVRVQLSSGELAGTPPKGPTSWHLETIAGGGIKIVAEYDETGDNRADTWAISYSPLGTPAEDSPDVTVTMTESSGPERLAYEIAAIGDGLDVEVRLQTRRTDGAVNYYSEDSVVKEITTDATCTATPNKAGATIA